MNQRLQIFAGSPTEMPADSSAAASESSQSARVFLSIPDCSDRLRNAPRGITLTAWTDALTWWQQLTPWRSLRDKVKLRTWLAAGTVFLVLAAVTSLVMMSMSGDSHETRGTEQTATQDEAPSWGVTSSTTETAVAPPRELLPGIHHAAARQIAPPRDPSNDARANDPAVIDSAGPQFRTSHLPEPPVANETVGPRMPWVRLNGTIK